MRSYNFRIPAYWDTLYDYLKAVMHHMYLPSFRFRLSCERGRLRCVDGVQFCDQSRGQASNVPRILQNSSVNVSETYRMGACKALLAGECRPQSERFVAAALVNAFPHESCSSDQIQCLEVMRICSNPDSFVGQR